MYQSWNHISFLHWRCSPKILQSRLPNGLGVDTCNGTGWISITPFLLEHLRPDHFPAIPWLSRFPETNLRTYVQGPRGPGIWFFSLDAARLPAVFGARAGFGLPYFWSRMDVTVEESGAQYRTDYTLRRSRQTFAKIRVRTLESLRQPDPLSRFLTARYRLYAIRLGQLITVEVEHRPWPLWQAKVLECEQTLTRAASLYAAPHPDMVHFSTGVDVKVSFPQPIKAESELQSS